MCDIYGDNGFTSILESTVKLSAMNTEYIVYSHVHPALFK